MRPDPAGPPVTRHAGAMPSRPLIHRLAALFALDSLAGGFVLQSLIAYWLYTRFGMDLAALGWTFFGAQILSGLSLLLAARLAPRLGLVNTMVFSHLISNVLLIGVALAPSAGARGHPAAGPPPALPDGRAHPPELPHAGGAGSRAGGRGQPHQHEPHPRPVGEPRPHRLGDGERVARRAVLPGRRAQDPLRPDALRDDPQAWRRDDPAPDPRRRGGAADPGRVHRRGRGRRSRRQGAGRALGPGVLGLHVPGGGFHVKAAGLPARPPLRRRQAQRQLPRQRGAARAADDPGRGRALRRRGPGDPWRCWTRWRSPRCAPARPPRWPPGTWRARTRGWPPSSAAAARAGSRSPRSPGCGRSSASTRSTPTRPSRRASPEEMSAELGLDVRAGRAASRTSRPRSDIVRHVHALARAPAPSRRRRRRNLRRRGGRRQRATSTSWNRP